MKVQPRLRLREFDPRTSATDREIRECVRNLLASHFGRTYAMERRRERRFPFPHLVQLTPLSDDGRTPSGPAMVAVGGELSEGGFGFYHASPLAHRQMIASLETVDKRWFSLVIDLTWCRFMRQGWYESGGRFLRHDRHRCAGAAATSRPARVSDLGGVGVHASACRAHAESVNSNSGVRSACGQAFSLIAKFVGELGPQCAAPLGGPQLEESVQAGRDRLRVGR